MKNSNKSCWVFKWQQLNIKFFIFILCVWLLCLHTCLSTKYAAGPLLDHSGTGVTDSCDLTCVSLCNSSKCLITKPSLYTPTRHSKDYFFFLFFFSFSFFLSSFLWYSNLTVPIVEIFYSRISLKDYLKKEMAHLLRILAALPLAEDLCSIFSTHLIAHNHPWF